MASTPEKLAKAREAALRSPRLGKHGKAKKTIAKESARVLYELKILSKLEKITDVQLKAILKEKNWRERTEAIKQLIGIKKTIEGNPDAPLIIELSKTIATKNGIVPTE